MVRIFGGFVSATLQCEYAKPNARLHGQVSKTRPGRFLKSQRGVSAGESAISGSESTQLWTKRPSLMPGGGSRPSNRLPALVERSLLVTYIQKHDRRIAFSSGTYKSGGMKGMTLTYEVTSIYKEYYGHGNELDYK